MTESIATQFFTTLAGNGGSITPTAGTFTVADALPTKLVPPFRGCIFRKGSTRGETVLVESVTGLTWTVLRGQEQDRGAPAASAHNDGDFVACVLTAEGLTNIIEASAGTLPAVAGTAISAHRAVVQLGDGRVHYADPISIAHAALPLWMSLTAASAPGDALTVQTFGEVIEPSWSWVSGPVYVGASGVLTQTFVDLGAGTWSRTIGAALDATTVFVSPTAAIVLAA